MKISITHQHITIYNKKTKDTKSASVVSSGNVTDEIKRVLGKGNHVINDWVITKKVTIKQHLGL